MANWYKKNPTKDDIEQARKEAQSSDARRFWLKDGESKRIIFLDDEPFAIHEHNPTINGEFWHYFTCRKGVDPNDPMCPMCMSKVKRQYNGFLTVLDATGWRNRKDELVLYNRQLFPMTPKTLDKFNMIKAKKTSLVGAQFELTRTSKDAVRVGDHWDFEEVVDPFKDEKYWFESRLQKKKLAPEPFDYMKIFEPLSSEEMQSVGSGGGRQSGSSGTGKDGDNEGGDEDQLY